MRICLQCWQVTEYGGESRGEAGRRSQDEYDPDKEEEGGEEERQRSRDSQIEELNGSHPCRGKPCHMKGWGECEYRSTNDRNGSFARWTGA